MPDRHLELPAHPDLEYYRKQAKHLLRSCEAGDAAARDPATGRPPACEGKGQAAMPHRPMPCSPSCAAVTRARWPGCRPMCPGTPMPPTPESIQFFPAAGEWNHAQRWIQ